MENFETLSIYVKHFICFSISSSLTMKNTEVMLIMMYAKNFNYYKIVS